VVKELAPTEHQHIVKSLRDVTPFTVSRFMSRAQAEEIEKMLTHELKRDVVVVTDNVVMMRVEEIDAADVAKMLKGA